MSVFEQANVVRVKPFSVLLVCTANEARSAMGELLLRRALAPLELGWHVGSAGTQARPGKPIHPHAAEALAEIGVESKDFLTSRLSTAMIANADLILTASSVHRHEVVTMDVHALPRTFTLLQFARFAQVLVLDTTSVGTLGPDLVVGATLARSRLQPSEPGGDDLPDPITGRLRNFRSSRDAIDSAIAQIVRPIAESPAESARSALGAEARGPEPRRPSPRPVTEPGNAVPVRPGTPGFRRSRRRTRP